MAFVLHMCRNMYNREKILHEKHKKKELQKKLELTFHDNHKRYTTQIMYVIIINGKIDGKGEYSDVNIKCIS